MRNIIRYLVVSMALMSAASHASETLQTEKVKTGILPSGGFYSLYEVACDDKNTASIASLSRKKRWCTSYDGEMSCFSRAQEASTRACMSGALAAAGGGDFKDADKFQ
jgi:hypothetical protein